MKVQDKVVIVTGGSGLIGRYIVSHLKENGAIAINADISVETNFSEVTIFCDISSEESIKNTVFTVLEKYGRIDGLVNNAYPRTSDWGAFFENIPLESWRKNVDMQLNSTFLFCQLVLEQMKKQGSGSVVIS